MESAKERRYSCICNRSVMGGYQVVGGKQRGGFQLAERWPRGKMARVQQGLLLQDAASCLHQTGVHGINLQRGLKIRNASRVWGV